MTVTDSRDKAEDMIQPFFTFSFVKLLLLFHAELIQYHTSDS